MNMTKIEDKLNAAKLAIQNTQGDDELQSLVGAYGYNAAAMQEGLALYTKALEAYGKQKALAGSQKDATARLKEFEAEAREAYQGLAQVARAVFKSDRAVLKSLNLEGNMPALASVFISRAYVLFDNAANLAEAKETLSRYGYNAQKLAEERAKIEDFDEASQAQEAAKGTAQQATRDQEAAIDAMIGWLMQYLRIAKVALRGKPELLEKLGVLARSVRTKAQRKASEKASATRALKKTA